MSVHMIYYRGGTKVMRPIRSREEYLSLRGTTRQRAILKAVRNGDKRQKGHLLQMNYSCLPNKDGSLKGSTRMSSSVGMGAVTRPSCPSHVSSAWSTVR